ncbi:hypothetical protein [Parerythrobacter lacustris]|uniref:Uncharacterized protein n=1 Tax=Parerythrobacter lacustris TaxID=2969984 RepID=A0ABT1XTI5_9SPHN|nr:hypothetical protein [Parerythrobacter lacustris]MCR2834970.1 hypothetical protein [Parerythrobacter lacustris]
MRMIRSSAMWLVPVALATLAACSGSDPAATASGQPSEGVFPDQPEPAPAGRFAPRNECVELPGAKLFFVDLGKAVRDRDVDALLKLTAADVKLDFGGGGGLTTFKERLADKDGKLWEELDKLLDLGCAVDEGGDMVLPWLFAQDLGVDDPFSTMVTLGPDVVMRERPEKSAPVVETIAWDTVQLADGFDPAAEFAAVTSRSGKPGFIANAMLRSPVDYRLYIARNGERWQIVSFVAGD